MKKLLRTLSLVLLLMALGWTLPIKATIYWCGGNEDWTPQPTTTFETTDDNTYTYECIVAGTIYFAIADGQGSSASDWGNFNSNYRYSYNSTNGAELNVDTEYTLSKSGDYSMKFTGEGKYRFTFVESTKKLTITKLPDAIPNAEIETIALFGEFNSWADGLTLTSSEDNVYTGTLDLSATEANQEFKLVVNGNWIGADSETTIDAPDGWITLQNTGDKNYILNNATIPFKTYTITATWEPNPNPTASWTLKIEGATPYDTYTVTFENTDNWEKVYAYVWSGTGNETTAPVAWPGTDITSTGSENIYTFSRQLFSIPEYIIFNNGLSDSELEQTMDQAFVPGKQYDAEPITVTAKVAASGYATFSSEFALDFTEITTIKAYRAEVSDGNVVLHRVSGKVPANTGLLLAGEPNAQAEVEATKEVSPIGTNLLVATVDATEVAASTTGSYNYFLSTKDSKTGFYYLAAATTSAAGKAYLHTTTELSSDANARVAWIFDDEETTTGITETKTAQTNSTYYNLAGQRIKTPTKGMFIVNGKKIIMK